MDEIAWFWIAATALTAGLGLMASSQQSKSMRNQARAKDVEAQVAELGVKQTAARRMESLMADIGAIQAKRATSNVAATSGSAVAAEGGYEKEYLRTLRSDILSQRYNIVSRRSEASALRVGARATMISGYANALGSAVSAYGTFGGGAPGGKPAGAPSGGSNTSGAGMGSVVSRRS